MRCWLPRLFAVVLAGAVATPSVAAEPPAGWAALMAGGQAVDVRARPVGLAGELAPGLTVRGAWVLTGNRPEFGSFSGLLVRDGQLYSVTDNAWWFGARIVERDGGLELRDALMVPVKGEDGNVFSKDEGDAEGLALYRGHLMVSFERDHRIMQLGDNGQMEDRIALPAFGELKPNRGLEALATLADPRPPGGGLIAFAEVRGRAGTPVFVLRADGGVAERLLPLTWLHSVTGADLGPDGRLYLVLREYSALFGISIRVVRYSLDDEGLPVADSAETLAAFEADSGIDNMEGIAAESGPDGGIRLWLISDDNFRGTQRTLLVALDLR